MFPIEDNRFDVAIGLALFQIDNHLKWYTQNDQVLCSPNKSK